MKLKSVAVNDLMTTVYNYGYRVYDCQAQVCVVQREPTNDVRSPC